MKNESVAHMKCAPFPFILIASNTVDRHASCSSLLLTRGIEQVKNPRTRTEVLLRNHLFISMQVSGY